MPLTRGRIVGYDDERLAFGFTMLIGTTVVWLIVPCFDNHPVEKEEATAGS